MTTPPSEREDLLSPDMLHPLLGLAKELAEQAGRLVRSRLATAEVRLKDDRSLVTDVDHAAQKLILDELARRHPEHAVLAEEVIPEPDRHAPLDAAPIAWIIDPIDGTRNYARGFPVFSVSIAVFVDARPAVGVIYDPMTDMLYHAAAGCGAFLRDAGLPDRRLSANLTDAQGGTFVAITSSKRSPSPERIRRWLDWIVLRNVGSTALHLAYVAAGSLDGAYAHDCKLWDIAAGMVLIPEAGGMFTRSDGSPFPLRRLSEYLDRPTPVLAGTPATHQKLLETLP